MAKTATFAKKAKTPSETATQKKEKRTPPPGVRRSSRLLRQPQFEVPEPTDKSTGKNPAKGAEQGKKRKVSNKGFQQRSSKKATGAGITANIPKKKPGQWQTVSLPQELLSAMVEAGGAVRQMGDEVFAFIEVSAGSLAHQVYIDAMVTTVSDPGVQAIFAPPAPFGGVVPQPALWGPLTLEANSIITAYQNLLAIAFAGNAVPPAALLMAPPALPIIYNTAQIACRKLIERIQTPGAVFPTINQLGVGTYICTVQHIHANCLISIAVTRA